MNCPKCYSTSILCDYSLKSLTPNKFYYGLNTNIRNIESESIDTEECQIHYLELLFFCEFEKIPLCRICIQDHSGEDHKVWHKFDVIEKYILTLDEIRNNKERILQISKDSETINEELRLANKEFQHIINKPTPNWYSEIIQVLELLDMNLPSNPEIAPFLSDNSPITSNIITMLSSAPPPNHPIYEASSSFRSDGQNESELNDLAKPESEGSTKYILAYATRGTCDMFTYNFATQKFKSIKSSRKILKWSAVTHISPLKLLLTGGKTSKDEGSNNQCFLLSITDGSCESLDPMLSSHSSHVSVLHDNQVYIISGKNSTNGVSTECERLNLSTYKWFSIASNHIGRTCASGAVHNNTIYLIGGCKNNSIEKYDIVSDTWSLEPTRLFDVIWQHLSISIGDKILIFGGDSLYDSPTRYSFLLDPLTGVVSEIETLPVGHCWLCGWYPSLVRGNRIWVVGKDMKFITYNINTHEWKVMKNSARKLK